MCQHCRSDNVFVLFEWPTALCDHGRRHALADMVRLVANVLTSHERQGHADDFKLSSAGADGLALIMGAVEQALRFDVERVTPEKEG